MGNSQLLSLYIETNWKITLMHKLALGHKYNNIPAYRSSNIKQTAKLRWRTNTQYSLSKKNIPKYLVILLHTSSEQVCYKAVT